MLVDSVQNILNQTSQQEVAEKDDFMGKESFLKMLVAQLRYQNPLEPTKDQEFIAQLSQFSSLEQLQNMNEKLTQNVEWNMLLSQTINNTMATSLIGREVTAESNAVGLEQGETTDINFKSNEYASSGVVTIINSSGVTVRTIVVSDLEAGSHSVTWDGKDTEGNELETGSYQFRVSLNDSQGLPVSVTTIQKGTVDGVKYVDGQAFLQVNGAYIPLAYIVEVGAGGE